MRRLASLFLFFVFLSFQSCAQKENPIIPVPKKLDWKSGSFTFNHETNLKFDRGNKALQYAIAPLVQKLSKAANIDLLKNKQASASAISIQLSNDIKNHEGYKLDVRSDGIQIT